MARSLRYGRRGGTTVGRVTTSGLRDLLSYYTAVGMPQNPPGVEAFQGAYLANKKRWAETPKNGRLDWPRPDGRNAVDEPKPKLIRPVRPRQR
jgi:hypothetical protein